MGRPVKQAAEKRSAQLPGARVTIAELAIIQAKAIAAGMSLSDFIRQLAITGEATPPRSADGIDRLLVELNRAGNNLNQIARHLNSGGSLPNDVGHVLHQFHTVLEKVGRAYYGA